jgi:CheY-like chemotaxis protein
METLMRVLLVERRDEIIDMIRKQLRSLRIDPDKDIELVVATRMEDARQVAISTKTIDIAGIAGIIGPNVYGIPDTQSLIQLLTDSHKETVLCTISNDPRTRQNAVELGCHEETDRLGFAAKIKEYFDKRKLVSLT